MKRSIYRRFISLLSLVIALLVMVSAGVHAQSETPTPTPDGTEVNIVIVAGILEDAGNGNYTVNGYTVFVTPETVIAEGVEPGVAVIVTGVSLDDGGRIEALSIELLTSCDGDIVVIETLDDATEVGPTATPADGTDDGCTPPCDSTTDEPCDGDTDEDTDDGQSVCARDDHPVGLRIAAEFDMDYGDVMDLFCQGYGFGEIVIMLTLADGDLDTLNDILDLRSGGLGWGKIKKLYATDDEPAFRFLDDRSKDKPGRGNGGGKGNGNGGGNGNGNGNGGGNGNGNNGNGNGNGKGGGKKNG